MTLKFILYKVAPIDIKETLWNDNVTYYVYASEYVSKKKKKDRFGGISAVAREPVGIT